MLELRLTVDAFYNTGKIIAENFNNVFATLEGGYNVEVLPKCIHNFVDGINGNPKQFTETQTESDIKIWNDYELRIDMLLSNMNPYWKK